MTREIRKPNFFIVGAPKCGTTTIYKYLSMHPNVFVSDPKEPHFFATDIYTFVTKLDIYERIFSNVLPYHYAVGEASTSYLYSELAIRTILQWNKNAKFVVLVRNPVDQFVSLHSEECRFGFEPERNIEIAFDKYIQTDKATLESYRRNLRVYKDYGLFCSTGTHISRLLAIAGTERVHIIFFDDIVSDAKAMLRGLCLFLQIPFLDIPLEHENSCVVARCQIMTAIVGKMLESRDLTRVREFLFAATGRYHTHIIAMLWPILFKNANKTEMKQTFKQKLLSYFDKEVSTIEAITQRNLPHWRNL